MIQIKHKKKIFMISGFLVAIAICLAIVFGAQQLVKTWKARFGTSYPKKTLVVTIELGQRETFFEQLTEFAKAHNFEIHIDPTTPSGDTFSIYMSRKDVVVWGDNVSSPREEYDFVFYDEDPTNPASEDTIDSLYTSLKRFINEIPNVMMTEQRYRLTITTDENWRDEELFSRMKVVAEKNSLEYKISFYGSDPSDKTCFMVEIQGEGFHIVSDCPHNTLEKINIDFYLDYYKNPTVTSQETLDGLFNELKSLLGEIPNVTITEEK